MNLDHLVPLEIRKAGYEFERMRKRIIRHSKPKI